jgi:hypothetical protein
VKTDRLDIIDEVREARDIEMDRIDLDWSWGYDFGNDDESPTIDATPLRVSLLEAARISGQR